MGRLSRVQREVFPIDSVVISEPIQRVCVDWLSSRARVIECPYRETDRLRKALADAAGLVFGSYIARLTIAKITRLTNSPMTNMMIAVRYFIAPVSFLRHLSDQRQRPWPPCTLL